MMKRLSDNLLVQFSVFSLVIMGVLGTVIVLFLDARLGGAFDLLNDHETAMMTGVAINDTDPFSIPSMTRSVQELQWMTFGIVGGAFVVLYIGLVFIVRRSWQTINRQRNILNTNNMELALLAEVGRIITSSPNISDVYPRFAARVQEYVPFDHIAISSVDSEEAILLFIFESGINVPGRQAGDLAPMEGTLTEEVTRTRSPVRIEAVNVEELVRKVPGMAPA